MNGTDTGDEQEQAPRQEEELAGRSQGFGRGVRGSNGDRRLRTRRSILDRRIPATWIFAVLLAALWHGFWFVWPVPEKIDAAHRGAAHAPQVRYLPRSGEVSADMRSLWSPVLFALPTAVGFSRSVLGNELSPRPPIEAPAVSAMYLGKMDSFTGSAADGRFVTPNAAAFRNMTPLPHRGPERDVFAPSAGRHTGIERVLLSEALTEEHIQHVEWPEGELVTGNSSWEIKAHLEVDGQGFVTHVLLEESTDSAERNGLILRSLHRWRFAPGAAQRRGQVVLHYRAEPKMDPVSPGGGS